jgi:hypothetical protein
VAAVAARGSVCLQTFLKRGTLDPSFSGIRKSYRCVVAPTERASTLFAWKSTIDKETFYAIPTNGGVVMPLT